MWWTCWSTVVRVLVLYKANIIIISKSNFLWPWYSWAILMLHNSHLNHNVLTYFLVSSTFHKRLFLAHLTQRVMWAIVTTERPSSVRPLTFNILINSSEATGPIWTKLWWNGPWMAPFQNCVRWSRLPTKMAAKLKIEKRGDEILIVHCSFSVSQNELKF
jgi:hypothetical protein